MQDSFDRGSHSNLSSNTHILEKIRHQIASHEDQKYHVDVEELRSIYLKFDRDRSKHDYQQLDNFFHKNPVFSALRTQVDYSCIEELLKNLELEKRNKGEQLYRYGQPNCTTGYFVLSGTVSLKVPTLETVQVSCQKDLMSYLAINYADVIWHKCENGDELRSLVNQYRRAERAAEKTDTGSKSKIQVENLTATKALGKQGASKDGKDLEGGQKERKVLDLKSNGFNITTGKESFNQSGKKTKSKKTSSHRSSTLEAHQIWMFKAVEVLGPAQNFGEIALVDAQKLRTATATCEETTEVLALTRDIYERILDKALRRDREKRIECLRRFRIFKHMSNKQLEKLIPRIQQFTINRGRVMYKQGDPASGVYFIVSGSFEVSSRSNHVKEMADQAVAKNIDPIARLKLQEHTKVTFDRSLESMRVAVLGKGEIIGLEECQQRVNRNSSGDDVPSRQTSATCVEHNSHCLFLTYQDFSDLVLADMLTGKQVKVESIIKDYFKEARSNETQKTIWDGKTWDKQVMADGVEDEESKKKRQKLFRAKEYVNDKYWAQYMGLMVNNLKERAEIHLNAMDQDVRDEVMKKETQNENNFQVNYKFREGVATGQDYAKQQERGSSLPTNNSIRDGIQLPMESIFSQESSLFPHQQGMDPNVSIGPVDTSRFHGDQSKSTEVTQRNSPHPHVGSLDMIPKQQVSINMIVGDQDKAVRIGVSKGHVEKFGIDSIQSLEGQPMGSYTARNSQELANNSGSYIVDGKHRSQPQSIQKIGTKPEHHYHSQDQSQNSGSVYIKVGRPIGMQNSQHDNNFAAQMPSQQDPEHSLTVQKGKGNAGITQVVHQVVSGRLSLDSAEIRQQKKSEEPSDSVAVWKTATDGVAAASKTYSAINEAAHLEEINKKNRGRIISNKVATDGDAAEILEELNRQETDEHSQDFPLTKIMTPLSGHRFHSERVGFPTSTTPVDPKIKQKKQAIYQIKGAPVYVIGKDGKKISLAKPLKKDSTRQSENKQRIASRTIDHENRQSTAANKNTSDIIYVDGGPSRTGEEAVRVIQVQKRTASGRNRPVNQMPTFTQEVINLLPFEQLQNGGKVEHYNVVDKDRLPQIKKALMHEPALLSARGSPLGLTKNLKQMQKRVAHQRNQNVSEFQTIPALFTRQYKQKALGRRQSNGQNISHVSGTAHFQNQNLSTINYDNVKRGSMTLSHPHMMSDRNSLLPVIDSMGHLAAGHSPTLPSIQSFAQHQLEQQTHNCLFAPSVTTNARMKKMLKGKARKDKTLAAAQEKARLKEVNYAKAGAQDMQVTTAQEMDNTLTTKDGTKAEDLNTLVGSRGTEDDPVLVNKDMHKLFMHSGSGEVAHGGSRTVRHDGQVHNIPQPQPSREEQESALQSLKSEEMMASKQTSYQDGGDTDQNVIQGHQMQPVSTNPLVTAAETHSSLPIQHHILQPSPTSSQSASHEKLPQVNPNVISQNAAQAAGELMQAFLQNPRAGGPTISDFQQIQAKYQLTANEAYQIVIQQIQLQRLIFQPPTAATVVKISHQSYTSHIQTKREEVNMFRNVLMHKFSFDRTLKSNHAKNKKLSESQNDSKIQGVSTQTQQAEKQLKMLQRQGASQSAETTAIHHPGSINKLAENMATAHEQDRGANHTNTLQEPVTANPSPGLVTSEA